VQEADDDSDDAAGETKDTTTDLRKAGTITVSPPHKTRFYGVKTLSSDKIALDFKNIADEVIANLRDQGINLVVKIEIEAVDATGFDENKIRTVSENAKTLKFDQSGFESE